MAREMIEHLFSREPWPHQLAGVEQTIDALSNGAKSVCLTSPTGSGKTAMEIALAKHWAEERNERVLCLTNRILLTDQTRKVFRKDDVEVGVISSSMKWAEREEAQVQIATIQTILARQRRETYWVDADLVLADECFPAGTLIDGRPIESLSVGDAVRSLSASGRIERRTITKTFSRKVHAPLIEVALSNETFVLCTSSHPVFVLEYDAYIPADRLKPGDEVYVDPHVPMRGVRQSVRGEPEAGEPIADVLQHTMPKEGRERTQAASGLRVRRVREALQNTVPWQAGQEGVFPPVCPAITDSGGHCPQREALIGADASQESHAPSRDCRESLAGPQGKRAQAHCSRREWSGHDETGTMYCEDVELVADCGKDTTAEDWREYARSLQDRHWEPLAENRHRDRREFAQHAGSPSTGQNEADVPRIARVVSVEVYEPPSERQPRGVPESHLVYNLEVEGNNNYFANGLLVHNCHQVSSGASADLLNEYKDRGAKVVGVTATPLGVSNVCDELIVAARTRDLQDAGLLCYASWFAPSELDTRTLVKGKVDLNLTENEARKTWGPLRGGDAVRTRIVGNILDHYRQLHPELQHTLAFAPGVKESLWAAQFCTSMGIRSLHVDGEDFWVDGKLYDRKTDEQRFQAAREEWRAGDIPVLWNRFVFREALDEPHIKCIMLATPIGSYRSFLQCVGRGLRTHPDKDRCLVLDFGGGWWRHGSVNVNVDWESVYDCDDPDTISKNRIAEQRETGEPMGQVCPKCGMVHKAFSRLLVCQYCGHELRRGKPSRPILQADGTLVNVEGEPIKQWKIKATPGDKKSWASLYWNAVKKKNGDVTFNQLYQQAHYRSAVEQGSKKKPAFWKAYYPPRDLPLMPRAANDWHRTVADVARENLH